MIVTSGQQGLARESVPRPAEAPDADAGPPSEPVVTMLRMRVRPGCADEFVRAWEAAASSIADTPGQISQELFRDADDPMTFIITATWADRSRLDAFGRGADRERLTAALRDLRESAERHTYSSVQRMEGHGPR